MMIVNFKMDIKSPKERPFYQIEWEIANKKKVIEFCQTVFKFLRSNVSSRTLYDRLWCHPPILLISRAFDVGKSALERLCIGKL